MSGAAPPRPDPAAPTALRRLAAWLGPCLVAIAGAALFAWTWRAWADVLVDFGRELYVPWRLAGGAVLHRDVAWFNGPLSAGFNALVFRLAGPSYGALAWTNLALLAAAVALLYRLLARVSDHAAATAACLLVLALHGFGQQVGIGNYNWIAPYSHEVTHGIVLALAALALLELWRGRRGCAPLAAAGALLGLCFLTKAEVFLAGAVACGALLACLLAREPVARQGARKHLLAFAGGLIAPPLLSFALLWRSLPAGGALRATLGGWPHVLGGAAQELPFYRSMLGLDRPGELAVEMLAWTAGLAIALLPAAVIASALRPRTAAARWTALAVLLAQAAVLAALPIPWHRAGRPLPLVVALLAGVFAAALARRRRGAEGALELALSLLALALLARMGLNPRISHYGFALSLPAAALVATALVGWLPALLDRRGAAGSVARAAGLAILLVAAHAHLRKTREWLALKTHTVGAGGDRMRVDPRGPYVRAALGELERVLPPGGTLAVLPEGVMLNYLSRRTNPTPFVNFMPPELLLFGEDAMVAAFRSSPPDAVVLVHKDTSEYGLPLFGRDYGRALMELVRERYRSVRVLGAPPLQPGTPFGVEILVRR